jgi:hypothetical protein
MGMHAAANKMVGAGWKIRAAITTSNGGLTPETMRTQHPYAAPRGHRVLLELLILVSG